MWAAAALALDPAPHTSQAQERGELVGVQDDAVYALEALTPSASLAAQRESAVQLVEMMASRKGRLALRCAPVAVGRGALCVFIHQAGPLGPLRTVKA